MPGGELSCNGGRMKCGKRPEEVGEMRREELVDEDRDLWWFLLSAMWRSSTTLVMC